VIIELLFVIISMFKNTLKVQGILTKSKVFFITNSSNTVKTNSDQFKV